MTRTSERQQVRRLTGVYNVDAGLRGDFAHAFAQLRGTTPCAFAEITHSGRRRRPEWDALVATLEVPFEEVRLNERTPEVTAASEGLSPCVVAHTDDGPVVVLGTDDLERIGPNVLRFDQELRASVSALGLTLPEVR